MKTRLQLLEESKRRMDNENVFSSESNKEYTDLLHSISNAGGPTNITSTREDSRVIHKCIKDFYQTDSMEPIKRRA